MYLNSSPLDIVVLKALVQRWRSQFTSDRDKSSSEPQNFDQRRRIMTHALRLPWPRILSQNLEIWVAGNEIFVSILRFSQTKHRKQHHHWTWMYLISPGEVLLNARVGETPYLLKPSSHYRPQHVSFPKYKPDLKIYAVVQTWANQGTA